MTALAAIAALWARIPTKDKLYALAIGLLIGGFLWWNHHERAVGAANLASMQRHAAEAQAKSATAKINVGATNSTSAEVHYVSTINAAIPDSPHLLVLDHTSAACAVSVSDDSPAGIPAAESSVEHPRDVGPDLDKIGRDSDAQVIFLQSLLKSCVDIGACKVTN